ncbi:hypothetical protein PilKf_01004 [Pillotina sp. SPG140]|jgi:hypothetical protein
MLVVIMVLGIGAMALIFVNKWVKDDVGMKKLKMQKEIMELEKEKEERHLKLLEEENKKYDNIINGG